MKSKPGHRGTRQGAMAFSIRVCMAYSHVWDDNCINIKDKAKQAKTKRQQNALISEIRAKRTVSYNSTERSHS